MFYVHIVFCLFGGLAVPHVFMELIIRLLGKEDIERSFGGVFCAISMVGIACLGAVAGGELAEHFFPLEVDNVVVDVVESSGGTGND